MPQEEAAKVNVLWHVPPWSMGLASCDACTFDIRIIYRREYPTSLHRRSHTDYTAKSLVFYGYSFSPVLLRKNRHRTHNNSIKEEADNAPPFY